MHDRRRFVAGDRAFRSILEHSSEGVAVLDITGRLLYVTPPTARILGCEPAELAGRDSLALVHPDDRGAVQALLADLIPRQGTVVCASFRLRHSDGGWRWIAAEMRNLLHDPAIDGILSTYRDITEFRDAQAALRRTRDALEQHVRERTADLTKANEALRAEAAERRRAEARLQMLSHVTEQTADSVFVTNREGVIEYVNYAFEALTGYARSEAMGQTPRLFSSGLHDARFYATLWNTILEGRVFRTVVTNRAKDGRLFDEDQTITPLRDERGEITHFVSTGRDVTERKRSEQAMRRLNQLLEQETTRIAGLLHDEAGQFLTTAHIMLADIGRDLAPPARERIEEVRSHLDQVEQQLRRISHDLHPRILSDLGLVGTIRFRAEAFSRRTGVRTIVRAPDECHATPALQAALYRLVQEGLTNAGKHARATCVTLALNEDGEAIACSIHDDGAGFDAADGCGSGPGLGLQGMRDRIESLGGSLEIISAPSMGTELRARLPLER